VLRDRVTSWVHSHSTMQAASVQKRTNGQPPSHAMPIAIGAITADEMIRKVRLLRARAGVADT
jgi:hypothetical protein